MMPKMAPPERSSSSSWTTWDSGICTIAPLGPVLWQVRPSRYPGSTGPLTVKPFAGQVRTLPCSSGPRGCRQSSL